MAKSYTNTVSAQDAAGITSSFHTILFHILGTLFDKQFTQEFTITNNILYFSILVFYHNKAWFMSSNPRKYLLTGLDHENQDLKVFLSTDKIEHVITFCLFFKLEYLIYIILLVPWAYEDGQHSY